VKSSIAWIRHPAGHRLGIMARPRAGEWLEDEIAAWRADDVDDVFCLLEREEVSDLGLEPEAASCSSHGIGFHSFPIPDRGVPSTLTEAQKVAEHIFELGRAGKSVAIHCRAGIGRAALIAAAALVCAGLAPRAAFAAIAEARRLDVPDTDEQRDWLDRFAALVRLSDS
jgi:protein-tyrosine phosphatase